MAINFPADPQVDDTFTAADKTWKWNGTAWITLSSGGGGGGGGAPSAHAVTHGVAGTDPVTIASSQVSDFSSSAVSANTSAISGAVSTHNADTTDVHGITDTSALATKTYADSSATSAAASAQAAAGVAAGAALSAHELDSTNIHGISDTSNLVYTNDSRLSNQRVPSDNSVTSAKIVNGTIVNEDISTTAAISQSKIDGLTTSLSDKQPLDADLTSIAGLGGTAGYLHKTSADTWELNDITPINTSSTSQTKSGDMTIVGTLTATDVVLTGTGTTIETTNLSVTDSLIYLADHQYTSDSIDIGIYGAYGSVGDSESSHPHTGLVRDASDGGKWKLVSGAGEPVSNVVDFAGATYDTLKVGAIEVTSTSVVTNLNADQLDGHDGSYFAVSGDLSTHTSATTSVHGITDTANLVYTADTRLMTFCTSSTRPSSPTDGQIIFETDTGRYYGYKNSTWTGIGGGAAYQTSAPSSPQAGDLWIDSDAAASLNENDYLLKADALTIYVKNDDYTHAFFMGGI